MTTQTEIARGLGVSQPTVAGYVRRGCPTSSVEAARAWVDANLEWRRRKGVRIDSTGSAARPESIAGSISRNLLQARLEREQAEASMATLRAREAAGELVRVDELRTRLGRRITAARELLRAIAPRLAPRLAAERDAAVIERMLEEAHAEFMLALVEVNTSVAVVGASDAT